MFLILQKMKLSSLKIQDLGLGSLRIFHHCFVRCFFFTTGFYYCFPGVFISPTFLSVEAFCQALCFQLLYRDYYGFVKAFFTLRRFLPHTLSQHLAQPAFINASLGAGSSLLKMQHLPLKFETQIQSICLFESRSVK